MRCTLHTLFHMINRYLEKIGNHKERIQNLFFTYSAVLRAVSRASIILESYNYETDLDPYLDNQTSVYVNELLDKIGSQCTFQEGYFFS